MSDENENIEEDGNEDEVSQEELDARLDAGPSRMDALKEKARAMGISHSPNIGEDTLAEKIRAHEEALEAKRSAEKTKATTPIPAPRAPQTTQEEPRVIQTAPRTTRKSDIPPIDELLKMDTDEILSYSRAQQVRIIRARQRHEHMRLIRCQIHCNNPAKNDLHGEIFSVQNKYIGTVRKFIPFGEKTENGYHVPAILVEALRRRKYQKVGSVKNPDGTERVVSSLAPEFTIVELPPLTKEELERMAVRQAATANLGFMGA